MSKYELIYIVTACVIIFFSCSLSIVEFGPVKTAMRENTRTLLGDVDDSHVDKYTLELAALNEQNKLKLINSDTTQTSEEAAQVILNVLKQDKPKFRNQATEFVGKQVATKLTDPSSEKNVQGMIDFFLTE